MRIFIMIAFVLFGYCVVATAKESTTLMSSDKKIAIRFQVPGACTSVDSLGVSDKPANIFQCGPGNPVTVKQITTYFGDAALAKLYRQETGKTGAVTFRTRKMGWGTLKTVCTPVDGPICFYYLKFKAGKLILEMSGSKSVVIDFTKIKLDSQLP